MRWLRFPIRGLVFAACVVVAVIYPRQPAATALSQNEEREIYSAVLDSLFGGKAPAAWVIETMPLSMPTPVASDWGWLGEGTAGLRALVEARAEPPPPKPFTRDHFQTGTILVPREEIAELFRNAQADGTPESRWLPFRSKFKVQSYQGLSEPVITADGLNALVWYSNACGSLCGEAGYAWLRRPSLRAAWAVVKRLPKVVS